MTQTPAKSGTARPLHRRPGPLQRDRTYEPFHPYKGVVVQPGTEPIYLYLRRSRLFEEDKGGDTIERHRLDLQRQLASDGCWTVVGEYIDNDSASPTASRTRRGWRLLNEAIEDGRVKALAFWKLDRTNRDAAQTLIWLARCREFGVTLVSNQDPASELNNASGSAKLVVGVKALLAEVELTTMSERQRNSKLHLAEAGFHHGGMVPFGWRVGERVTDEHDRSGRKLIPHEVEHPALKLAVQMVLEGHSLRAICNVWKDELGIVTHEEHRIPSNHLLRYLKSPRMIGYRPFQVPDKWSDTKGKDPLQWVARDRHGDPILTQEPVCDEVTWRRMLKILAERAKDPRGKRVANSASDWILSGLLKCPTCDRNLYGYWPRHAGVKTRSYGCRTNTMLGKGSCTAGVSINADLADAHVLGWVAARVTREKLDIIRAELEAQTAERGPVPAVRRELEELRAEREALVALQGTNEYRGARVLNLVRMIEDVEGRIDGRERQLNVLLASQSPSMTGAEMLADWESMSVSQKRAALGSVIRRIDVKRGRSPIEERLTVVSRYAVLSAD